MKTKSRSSKVKKIQYKWLMFWLLVLTNVALVASIFGNVDVRTFKSGAIVVDDEIDATEPFEDAAEAPDAVEENTGSAVECATPIDTPIDTYVKYLDQKTGVSVSLPYSFGWRGPGCTISPADAYDTSIGFGPGHIYGRYANLEIRPRGDAEQIIRGETESAPTSADQLGAVTGLRRRTINGLAVTSYSHALDIGGDENVWIAVGKTYSYIIRGYAWLTDAEAIKIIQSLKVTK